MESSFKLSQSSYLHSSISHDVTRKWNSSSGFSTYSFMYPVFIIEDDNAMEEISSMPGVNRYGIKQLIVHLKPLVDNGLKSLLLFGVIKNLRKDELGSNADSPENPVVRAVPILKKEFPQVLIACDVCLCPYTSHGHCGFLKENGQIDNPKSIERIAEVARSYAFAGCDVVAPSDMMDGRVGSIKSALLSGGLSSTSILSYSAKFCSSFYGPFRDACSSAPAMGNRSAYQLPPASKGLPLRAALRDAQEGADFLMVKPGMAYLDIIYRVKAALPDYPLLVYQVSGEYSMLHHAAKAGSIDLKAGVIEVLNAFKRAGADCVITYFTPDILNWLKEGAL